MRPCTPPDGLAARLPLVLDTNLALDLLLFQDPSTAALRQTLNTGEADWFSTEPMQAEFLRVLDYPGIERQRRARGLDNAGLMRAYQDATLLRPVAPLAAVRCDDPDDQCFVDLAVALRACLLSRDQAVLRLRPRLAALGVRVASTWEEASGTCRL
jgi:predicted nucleic acid-binding protein